MSTRSALETQTIANLLLRVYEIHEKTIARTGGLEGLRDAAMLHSAIARPFATFGGDELYPTDWEKAAALFHSLIKSHPFMDGTKRTAFASTIYFLKELGHPIPPDLPKPEIIRFCLELAGENMRIAAGEDIQPKTISEIAALLHAFRRRRGNRLTDVVWRRDVKKGEAIMPRLLRSVGMVTA